MVGLVFTAVYSNAENHHTEKTMGLHIKIVDEKHHAFSVQNVRWWSLDQWNIKHELKCRTDLCFEWVLEKKLSGSIVIYATRSIMKKEDEQCWDLFAGEVIIEMPAREAVIVMAYKNTACS